MLTSAQAPAPQSSPAASSEWASSKIFSTGYSHPKAAALQQSVKPSTSVPCATGSDGQHGGASDCDSGGGFKGLKRKWILDHSKEQDDREKKIKEEQDERDKKIKEEQEALAAANEAKRRVGPTLHHKMPIHVT